MKNDYIRIEKAIKFLDANRLEQPSLEAVAEHVGLSRFHFQKLFTRWTGVSPKKYLQHLTLGRAKEILSSSASVLEASYEVGLSGPSRLHDLFVSTESITPGEFKSSGEGVRIRFGFHDTPFGECVTGHTDRGLCALEFIDDRYKALESLGSKWQRAEFIHDQSAGAEDVSRIFYAREGNIKLFLKGTGFQLKVWEALLKIPEGNLVSYGDVAAYIGCASSQRAVGNAAGQNPIGYLIPCHRVLRSNGTISGYRWGPDKKRVIMAYESIRSEELEAVSK